MTNIGNTKWLAVHLFYNEPWEIFLLESVKPFVDTLIQAGIAEQYFFIRYWDQGPHIRLRIKGEASVLDNIVRPNIEEHFQVYFESRPSFRIDPTYISNYPEGSKWYPNDSIQFITYQQELDRFGGAKGILLAERQFQLSSEIVLETIKQKNKEWSYDEVLGIAIKLHLSFIFTMGLNLEEIKSFFNIIFQNSLPRAFRFYNNKLSRAMYKEQEKETLIAFKEAFELQKDSLIPYHRNLWKALKDEREFEEEGMSNWINKHEELKNDFSIAYELNQLDFRSKRYEIKMYDSYTLKQNLLWPIYSDFIHLTNNRLGISNKDEAYLAYLIFQSLKQITTPKLKLSPIKNWNNNT